MSNVGAWDEHYEHMTHPVAYGQDSYSKIAQEVAGCDTVEDWGCGGGALRAFLSMSQTYVGIDGSKSPYATVRADLTRYHSRACAVVLRHVLEHNVEWQAVLANAVESFRSTLVVVLFTPMVGQTRVMFTEPNYHDVPVIAFRAGDLLAEFPPDMIVDYEPDVPSPDTAFGVETFITARR